MKLECSELIRATDKQLEVLGVRRYKTPGWLRETAKVEFSAEHIATFRAADTRDPARLTRQKKTPRVNRGPSDFDAESFANRLYERCGRNLSPIPEPMYKQAREVKNPAFA